jgi:hypothetical protein
MNGISQLKRSRSDRIFVLFNTFKIKMTQCPNVTEMAKAGMIFTSTFSNSLGNKVRLAANNAQLHTHTFLLFRAAGARQR